MLKHDLEIADKARFDCTHCRAELDHHRQDTIWKRGEEDDLVMVLIMRCRLCWNELEIPARYFGTGKLTQLIVRR